MTSPQSPDWWKSDRLLLKRNRELFDCADALSAQAIETRDLKLALQATALWRLAFAAEETRCHNLANQMVLHGVCRVPDEWFLEEAAS